LIGAKRLHQVEDEIGCAADQPGAQLADVAVDAKNGNLVFAFFERPGDLIHDHVMLFVAFAFDVGQDGNVHGASRERGRGRTHALVGC
jgi:hypothetical protein